MQQRRPRRLLLAVFLSVLHLYWRSFVSAVCWTSAGRWALRPRINRRYGWRPAPCKSNTRRHRASSNVDQGAPDRSRSFVLVSGPVLPYVLLTLMMGHKCLTDGLGRFTRVSGTPYSATGAAILGEVTKVPVLLLAILLFEGRERLGWILRESVRDAPFSLVLPGLAYSSQNILYFQALSHVSVATYQILSQSKLLFTAFFMVVLFNKRITGRQVFALVLLMVGSFMTQLSEMSRSAATGGNALYGCVLTLAGAVTSALPNVYYEKVLKDKASNQWVKNIQLTFWISVGLVLFGLPSMLGSLGSQGASSPGLWTGITPWVWALVWLQSLKCLLVPATLKYADNILYSYIKPVSIVLTAAVSAVVSGIVPTGSFVGGALLVMVSVWLYGA